MTGSSGTAGPHRLRLVDEAATMRLAVDIAAIVRPGDIVALSGHLGAGKSLFARALLRELAGDPQLEAPSPTFTLVQSYETPRGPVLHADLYRVRSPDELDDIGLIEDIDQAVLLVEWPDRAGARLPAARRLDIVLEVDADRPETGRIVDLAGGVLWKQRLAIAVASRMLIDEAGWGEAARVFMMGDASTRAYERLTRPGGETAVLMISPARPSVHR